MLSFCSDPGGFALARADMHGRMTVALLIDHQREDALRGHGRSAQGDLHHRLDAHCVREVCL